MQSEFGRGVALALGSCAFLAATIVVNRFAVVTLQLQILPLVFAQLLFGGAALAVLGRSAGARDMAGLFRDPATWTVAAARAGNWLLYMYALLFLSATEAEFLLKWCVLMAFGLAVVIGGVRPRGPLALAGAALMAALLTMLSLSAPPLGLLAALGAAACIVLEGAVAERHARLSARLTFAEGALFAGSVMLATASVIAMVWACGGALGVTDAPLSALLAPELAAMAAFSGALLRAGYTLLRFQALPAIGNTFLNAVYSALPFCVLGLELLFEAAGALEVDTLSRQDIVIGSAIAAISAMLILSRMRQEAKARGSVRIDA